MEYKLIAMRGLFAEFTAKLELQSKSFHDNNIHGVIHYVLQDNFKTTNVFVFNKHMLVENNIDSGEILKFVEILFLKTVDVETYKIDIDSILFAEHLKDLLSES